jgi:hypothetical protein
MDQLFTVKDTSQIDRFIEIAIWTIVKRDKLSFTIKITGIGQKYFYEEIRKNILKISIFTINFTGR